MNAEYLRSLLDKYIYHDTFDIKRQVRITDGYVDDFEQETVYSNVKGVLHQYGKTLFSHRDDVSQKLTADLRLCCRPDVDIRPNDYVIVTHCGQTWELVAGESFRYVSHQEISCRRRKEAGQN